MKGKKDSNNFLKEKPNRNPKPTSPKPHPGHLQVAASPTPSSTRPSPVLHPLPLLQCARV